MKQILPYLTIISALVLVIIVLLQNQGTSLGSAFGGETNFYRSKRGLERILFYATIVAALIFVGSILAGLLVR